MRIVLSVVFAVLILGLAACTIIARLSRKPNGKAVALLVSSLIPPVTGNLFIIASNFEILSKIGCYIYFLGMNYVMFAVVRFTVEYCEVSAKKYRIIEFIVYGLLILDSFQLLANIFTNHAFVMMQTTDAWGSTYYQFSPLLGQTIHRVLDYSVLTGVIVAFIIKSFRSPKVYREKYLVILLAMLVVAGWQTFYIVSGTPVDISMIGFAVFGFLVFFLALYYRPLKLLDRMLASIASRMNESLLFFDKNGRCIWANDKAYELFNIYDTGLDSVGDTIDMRFGRSCKEGRDWKEEICIGSGEGKTSYVVEKNIVFDSRQKEVGYYLGIRDNTEERRNLDRETYAATHDSLTKIYNRLGYEELLEQTDINKCFLVLFDLDSFKAANDKFGHSIGDNVLIRVVEVVSKYFNETNYLCRIGGDEFAVIISEANMDTPMFVRNCIDHINDELENKGVRLPAISISAGGAFGKDAENFYELFNNADHALYETKFKGKRGFTLFAKR